DVYTVSANLAGLPAVSFPVADVDGLPAGAQLMAAPWEEERMLGLAARLEGLAGYAPGGLPEPASEGKGGRP
ncbi:MAG TPA: amidase family protein, partial [Gemmatimonadota bacterium]|nr:amidase family protein [Gemmatimonadota bacterium]